MRRDVKSERNKSTETAAAAAVCTLEKYSTFNFLCVSPSPQATGADKLMRAPGIPVQQQRVTTTSMLFWSFFFGEKKKKKGLFRNTAYLLLLLLLPIYPCDRWQAFSSRPPSAQDIDTPPVNYRG